MRDLIVVGAGPVGTHLAGRFAEKGKDVLVIERSDEIGKPLACSGHVSPDIWKFVPEEKRDELLQNSIRGARFHLENGSEHSFYKQETVSHAIDRIGLDKTKAEQAIERGAEIKTGEAVKKVNEKEGMVEIRTEQESYSAKMVAGCDGASSTVRDEVGLPEPDHFYQGILCFSQEEDDQDFVDVFLDVPEFFGWRIPRSDSVEYGAAVPKGEEPIKWLNSVTDGYIDRDEQENICAGAIPIGPPEKVTSERVFLVGDAAGQTKPFTGGGILYGMRCAEEASEVIDIDRPETLEDYEELWRDEIGNEIRLGGFIEMFYSAPSFIQSPIMSFFDGEIGVHMDEPSTLFSLQQLKALLPENVKDVKK